jgi:hypothetical protein
VVYCLKQPECSTKVCEQVDGRVRGERESPGRPWATFARRCLVGRRGSHSEADSARLARTEMWRLIDLVRTSCTVHGKKPGGSAACDRRYRPIRARWVQRDAVVWILHMLQTLGGRSERSMVETEEPAWGACGTGKVIETKAMCGRRVLC